LLVQNEEEGKGNEEERKRKRAEMKDVLRRTRCE
jgi:hypothetical protein